MRRLTMRWLRRLGLPGSPHSAPVSHSSLAAHGVPGWLQGRMRRWYSLGACLALAAVVITVLAAARNVQAQPSAPLVSASASCATLAAADRSATNGADWGRTILPGHGAPGGWFGVDVCANGFPNVAGDSSSVSCDRWPSNWNRSGCAPGQPTSDGYGWTFQCPELVVRFSAWAFGDNPGDWGRTGWGNAPDLWVPANHPSDFVMYPNGSTQAPVPGDILVWGWVNNKGQPWPAGPDGEHGGHIAVVAAVTNGYVITAEQNVQWGTQDHPSDQLALTKVGNRWILSGSQAHETTLPTYRWPRTMGYSRATYGWLHSIRNTGHFPSSSRAVSVPAHGNGTSVPQQPSGGFPSLEAATVVTSDGQLTDLVWSNSDVFNPNTNADGPHAAVRNLGAPPGTRLMEGQRPATIALADGSRVSYALGTDGHLYAARVVPASFGVFWSDLGQPGGVMLRGSVSASSYAGGLAVLALGSDGNLWWRAGPENNAGSWQQIGQPGGTQIAGSFVLTGAPGTGTPLVLALGKDGRLYERLWMDTQYAADGSVEVPAGWSDWRALEAQPAHVQFTGALMAVSETAQAHDYIGTWADAPLDIAALDTQGQLWLLRVVTIQTGWHITQVTAPAPLSALLGATVVDGPASATTATNTTTATATATPTATAATTKGTVPQPAQALQLYAASAKQSYTLSLSLPATSGSGGALATTGSWAGLPLLPGGASAAVVGVALPLAQDSSALVIAVGNEILVGGSAASASTLLPTDQSSTATGDASSSPTSSSGVWLRVGSLATAPAFSDMLEGAVIDPRWVQIGVNARNAAGSSGVRLQPASSGVAALLQSADAGDFTLATYVSIPAHFSGKAGLIVYLDDNDWLMLLVDHTGHVSLCGMAWQSASPCATISVKATAVTHGLWLQLARQGNVFTGAVSLDHITWRAVGGWAPPHTDAPIAGWNGTPQASPTPVRHAGVAPTASNGTAKPGVEPLAPLAFTSWGIISMGSSAMADAPLFNNFTVLASVPPAGATNGAAMEPLI